MENKAKEFRNAAKLMGDGDPGKTELLKLAGDLETFAKHDRGLASWRREKAKEFRKQAEGATQGAKNHRDAAEREKALLGKLGA